MEFKMLPFREKKLIQNYRKQIAGFDMPRHKY